MIGGMLPAGEHCWTRAQVGAMCRGIAAVLACPDLASAARQILSSCRELIGARAASVTLFGDGDGDATTVGYRGAAARARLLALPRLARADDLRAIAAKIGTGRIENQRPRLSGLPLPASSRAPFANLLVAPMIIDGAAAGLICLADKPGGFAEHDLRVTASFAQLAGVAHQRCLAAESLGRSEARLRRTAAELAASKRMLEMRVARATRALNRANAALRRRIEAYQAVKRSLDLEHGFRNAVEDSLLAGIIVADQKNRVIHVNRAFCRMVGWSRRQLLGATPPYPFWPPEQVAERLAVFRVIRRGSRPAGVIRARYMRRNGQRFDVQIMHSLLRGTGGAAAGLVASITDVTRQLQAETALRESASQLRRLSERLLSAEERERKRISRELHDGLGQTLSALKYRLEELVALCGAEAPTREVRHLLSGAARLLRSAIDEVRAVVMDLRPSILDDLGLIAAVRWLGREHERTHPGTQIATRIGVLERDVPEALKIVLFRLLQEALNNVAKHSRADRVGLRLAVVGSRLQLTVRDNGRGFARSPQQAGLGLLSMRERTELSGGVFSVVSRPGRGTVLRAGWPLRAPEAPRA